LRIDDDLLDEPSNELYSFPGSTGESANSRSPSGGRWLTAIGIDPVAFQTRYADRGFYPPLGLGPGIVFDEETFGEPVCAPTWSKKSDETLSGTRAAADKDGSKPLQRQQFR
jgi:hypothetical protein